MSTMLSNRFAPGSAAISTRRAVVAGISGGFVAALLGRFDVGAEVATPSASPAAETLEWLVTIEFGGASITGTAGETGPEDGVTISLTMVDPTAMAFTDRPAHMAAEWSVDSIVDAINDANESNDPLNANLSARIPDSMHKVGVILTLRSASHDQSEAAITLTADMVDSFVGESPADNALPLPTELRGGYLFIDSITNSTMYLIPQNGDPLIGE